MELERQDTESREGDVRTLFIGIVYKNDAVYQMTMHRPLDFKFALDAGQNAASLAPGMASESRREPRGLIMFEGNPDADGVQVHQEGEAP